MLKDLLLEKMKEQGLDFTKIARMADISPLTVKTALMLDGKLSTYHKIADVMGVTIKYTVE